MGEAANIRVATPTDRDAVLELWLELIDYHRSLDPDYPGALGIRDAVIDEILRGIEARSCQLLVAERDGVLLGFAFAEIEAETGEVAGEPGPCWVHEIFVASEARRSGIGSALLDFAERFFATRPGGRVVVRVESSNVDGLRFWERRGFAERARILERKS